MPSEVSPKLKIVYLMKILLEDTDETHSVTMQEIIKKLDTYGISAERKSVYNDLELLRLYGLDIIGEAKDKTYSYHIGERQFELAELKLLVDSVQSARFMTEKKSNALIKKIEGIASHYEAMQLQRQVYVTERVKTENEQVLYNIDAIHKAIADNSKITFQYFNWNVDKEMELRHDGARYELSPWALTLSDENYYVVTFDAAENTIKYFRVDKMLKIELTGDKREGKDQFDKFDIAAYAKKRFRMYDGKEMTVTLECKNSYAGVIIDRFGTDLSLHKTDAEHFKVNVNVAASKHFYGWVISMADGMRIVAPDTALKEMEELVKTLEHQYM